MSTATKPAAVCARITSRLQERLGGQRYRMWFGRSARLDYEEAGHRLEVAVPNRFVADWIGKNFDDELREAAAEAAGPEVSLSLTVRPDRFDGAAAEPQAADEPAAATRPRPPRRPSTEGSVGSLRHCLDTFVVGISNRLAYAAAARLAEPGDATEPPVFLHGGCGLGKTHLLQGLCRRFAAERPRARVLYTTGERFTNEFLQAVRGNSIARFRSRMRRLDLLAIDDIHFIAGKNATRQEFLHSFDAIDLAGARVALASDSHPRAIEQLGESLTSRCLQGMVVEINEPDSETRARIIAAIATRRGLRLREGVAEALADRAGPSVREIEGALTRLEALAELDAGAGEPIGHAVLNRACEAGTRPAARGPVRFGTILAVVSERLGVSREQICGNGRQRQVVLARSVVAHLGRRLTTMSFPEIATAMKRPTHSTIIAADKRIRARVGEREMVTLAGEREPLPLASLVESLERTIRDRRE